MEEYVIINRTKIEEKIKELKNQRDNEHKKGHNKSALRYENMILELKQILSESTPLIPEIEKSIDKGYDFARQNLYKADNTLQPKVKEYITNLKLDI